MEPQTIVAHLIAGGVVLTAVVDLLRRLKKDDKSPPHQQAEGRLLVSYLTLRRVIGLLGIGLPVALAVLGFLMFERFHLLDSMSAYYHFRTRDVFVGVLFVLGWFLFAYKGYDSTDDRAGDWAWLFALGVALCPSGHAGWQGIVHPWSATGLFLVLAYFSFFLFTKSDKEKGQQSARKQRQNLIYKVCAVAMLLFIATISLSYWLLDESTRHAISLVFWMEALALWAFGISWLVKGKAMRRLAALKGRG
jgi:hypothetical protein